MRKSSLVLAIAAILGLAAPSAQAETPEEWIILGARVHGGFGAFIPVGIRIGLDALERLKAGPREVTVLYLDSDKAPCACIADGIMLAHRRFAWPADPADCHGESSSRRLGGRYGPA